MLRKIKHTPIPSAQNPFNANFFNQNLPLTSKLRISLNKLLFQFAPVGNNVSMKLPNCRRLDETYPLPESQPFRLSSCSCILYEMSVELRSHQLQIRPFVRAQLVIVRGREYCYNLKQYYLIWGFVLWEFCTKRRYCGLTFALAYKKDFIKVYFTSFRHVFVLTYKAST